MMQPESFVEYYLQMFEEGDEENAFHGLLELPFDVVPELTAAYRISDDLSTRLFLLNVLWQTRQESAVPVLIEALHESEACLWQEAMDGLVTIRSDAAIEGLRSARARTFEKPRETVVFLQWLEEAIEQAVAKPE